ncbi:MAG: DUF86 domain-containing protein [Rhodospirillales bacterium]|nr:DUF86 domain-containing protein [Rhodospirillales bacterium]
MSFKDWRVRIEDILEALHRIRHYTENMSQEAFVADDRTIDAVVRNLEIVGEAARQLPSHVTQRHPEIPWSRMADMRNVLVHEYHAVDAEIVWRTVENDLPPLAGPLQAMLREPADAE